MSDHRAGEAHPIRNAYAAIFIASFLLLALEVATTRLLAYKFFYNLVFLVVALAQLGLAASGAWLFSENRTRIDDTFLSNAFGLTAAFVGLFLLVFGWGPPGTTITHAKLHGFVSLPYLGLMSIFLVGAYFHLGLILAGVFTHHKESFQKLYATDLVGASLACVAAIGSMWAFGPIRTVACAAVVAALAGLWLRRGGGTTVGVSIAVPVASLALGMGLVAMPGWVDPGWSAASKPIDFEWTHLARTDRIAPSYYVIDGDAATMVLPGGQSPWNADIEFSLVPESPTVAVIGSGSGPQVLQSIRHGAKHVTAIDINPSIIGWARGVDAPNIDDVYNDDRVDVVIDEARQAIRRQTGSFDLILMHAIDTYTATAAGAYSLSENYLYTVDAFEDYLSRLGPSGVMGVRRHLFNPPRETLRLFTTAMEAVRRSGREHPEQHLIVVAPVEDYADQPTDLKVTSYLMMSASPFTDAQLAALRGEVEARGFSLLYSPDEQQDSAFQRFVDAPDPAAFYGSYPYLVDPSFDSSPYFFQMMTPWRAMTRGAKVSFLYASSSLTLMWTFLGLVGLTVALILVPLRRIARAGHPPPRWSESVYFASLGLGFMLIEIGVIQVMTLILGHPTYALAVVLMAALAFASLGSLTSSLVPRRAESAVSVVIAAMGLVTAVAAFPIAHSILGLPFWGRVALVFAGLALLFVPMGAPMALGIRTLGQDRQVAVAWAWLINGVAGVLGATLCTLLMIYISIPAAMVAGSLCYGAAALAARRMG